MCGMEIQSSAHRDCEHASTEENTEQFLNSSEINELEAAVPNNCEQKLPAIAGNSSANSFDVIKCDIGVDVVETVNQVNNFEVSTDAHRQACVGGIDAKYGDMLDLSQMDIKFLKSLAGVIDDVKVSNFQLKETIDVLNAKYSALEKTSEDLECRNRTLERELAMLQSESDRTKRKLLQVASDVSSFVAATNEANIPKIAAGEVSEKESSGTNESTSELEMTKTNLLKLGNEVSGITSLLTDVNGKVTWLELEFQKFMRRHSLVIENLCPKEDKSASQMFLVFVNCVLNVTIEDGDIESVHVISQMSGSPEKRPRPILVTFACYGARSRVYKAWLAFRSSKVQGPGALSGERGQGVCIREYLTELQDSFYHEAVGLRDKHLIIDCWTFKGKTYIRTLDGEVKEFNKEQWISKNENVTSGCIIM